MAGPLNYAEQYSRELANAYPQVLHFAALRSTENDTRYTFLDAKTIHTFQQLVEKMRVVTRLQVFPGILRTIGKTRR